MISEFMRQSVDLHNDSMDDFVVHIREKSDLLYKLAVDIIFSRYEHETGNKVVPSASPSNYLTAIDFISEPSEYKLQVALLFSNFSYAINILIDSLQGVYNEIINLHKRYADLTKTVYNEIEKDDSIVKRLYGVNTSVDVSTVKDATITITLLNQYIIFYSIQDSRISFLMLGLHFQNCYSEYSGNNFSQASDFIVACGSTLRMKMLEGLISKKEMTLSEFARYVDSQPTTVIRNLQILKDSNIIVVSKHEAQQIFYKINTELLRQVRTSLNRFIDDLLK